MGIDFSSLVLAPAMATFARSVSITPFVSQPVPDIPGTPPVHVDPDPYAARGVWMVEAVSIPTEDGGILSSERLKFGIRIADFTVVPRQGDQVSTKASDLPLGYWQGAIDPNANIVFDVDDYTPDGQGGALLILKRTS